MVQTNIQVESTPLVTPVCKPCPPCGGTVVKRYSCYRACPVCAY
ncbi:13276_t:CDS:2 [Gigaspora margarita]|uniref:13276_t:CDS:1 n=1 Tax=Gigaspora margarita TaxID=4874 RepID=A0ABN7V2P0_GIGMA|nr:13276_t:CDS:2 [Gigaspora margarita]